MHIHGPRRDSIDRDYFSSATIRVRLIVIIAAMLNKPITHPTIKSFVYLDIDLRRDKGHSSSFDKSGHSRHTTRSLVRYARLRLLVRAGPSAEKGVPMLPMNAVCASRPRFPNVNLYSVKREKRGGRGERKKERKKERREEEQSRSVEGGGKREKESGGKRARRGGTTMHKVSQDARGNLATGGGGTKTYNGHNGRWILSLSLSLSTVWALGWVRRRYSL